MTRCRLGMMAGLFLGDQAGRDPIRPPRSDHRPICPCCTNAPGRRRLSLMLATIKRLPWRTAATNVGPHTAFAQVGRGLGVNAGVGRSDGLLQAGGQVRRGIAIVLLVQGLDGQAAGHLAGGVPAHPIGHSQQPATGGQVLVGSP